MSYTIRDTHGTEIICDTVEEMLAARKALAGEGSNGVSGPAKIPPAPKSSPRATKPGRAQPKERKLAEDTYLKLGWRCIRSLLGVENHEVGKMCITLARELNVSSTTGRILYARLEAEVPKFLHVRQTRRGQTAYVRLVDRVAAEEFATKQEALYKEQLRAELTTVDDKEQS